MKGEEGQEELGATTKVAENFDFRYAPTVTYLIKVVHSATVQTTQFMLNTWEILLGIWNFGTYQVEGILNN